MARGVPDTTRRCLNHKRAGLATPGSKSIVARGQGTLEEEAGLGVYFRADCRDFAGGDMAIVDAWSISAGVENSRRESGESEVGRNQRVDIRSGRVFQKRIFYAGENSDDVDPARLETSVAQW